MAQRGIKYQTVTLCMIVKDEAEVITRAFDSVKHIVDYYCICDTGSTDDTIKVIKQYFKENDCKGEVHERPWVNFGHNRTECFELGEGKSDYIMTLDADEVFCPYRNGEMQLSSIIKTLPKFETDSVEVYTEYGRIRYRRTQFMKDGLGWVWEQPLHEYPTSTKAESVTCLKDAVVFPSNDGARAKDPNCYAKDALIFENWLLDHPEDARAWFYLAQSYRDAKQYKKALEAIENVFPFSNWPEEIFEAALRKARLNILNGAKADDIVALFLKAYSLRPHRAEPLHDLLQYYVREKQYELAVLFGEAASKIPLPEDEVLFVEADIYNWRIKDELAIALFYVGRVEESLKLTSELIHSPSLPKEHLDRLRDNFMLCEKSMKDVSNG